MDKTDVTKDIMEEILENCNWIEKIWVRLNPKACIKIYKIGITFGHNNK